MLEIGRSLLVLLLLSSVNMPPCYLLLSLPGLSSVLIALNVALTGLELPRSATLLAPLESAWALLPRALMGNVAACRD